MKLFSLFLKIIGKMLGYMSGITYLYYVIKNERYGKFNWSNGSRGSFQRW
jgi:hypothetical protein